jgi:hypothetical protein
MVIKYSDKGIVTVFISYGIISNEIILDQIILNDKFSINFRENEEVRFIHHNKQSLLDSNMLPLELKKTRIVRINNQP